MSQHGARSNLSGEQNTFIGRERELDELLRLAPVTRALTLCGTGGIGKTRLAVRMLAALAGDYPDGVWFVEFADLWQPDLVESRIAAVIGVTEEPGRPLIETLADVLRPRRVLLALDNCEHLVEACARVCQRLLASSPELRVIVTSREPLRVAAETVWQVPPLGLPAAGAAGEDLLRSDAIRLFAERAAAVRASYAADRADWQAQAAVVAAVCRVLDGLPLAIELAAAWVRVLTVEQIAARLNDRFRLLKSSERTVPLRATIDWSFDLLTGPEQILLRRLSALAGWQIEMAENLCASDDLPGGQILDLLIALAEKSLVVADPDAPGQTRYRMLDTIRAYAQARLDEAGESEMMAGRLRAYTLGKVEEMHRIGMAQVRASWADRLESFRRFETEAGNLRQVLSRCAERGDAETGLRICVSMRPVWIVQGSFAEGSEWFDAFLGIHAPAVSDGVRGAALVGRAQLALATDPDAAQEGAEAGLGLCRAADERFWIASALNLLAEIALHSGRLDDAAAAAEEAIEVSRQAGDQWSEGYALGTRGAAAGLLGDLAAAKRHADAALAVMREIDQQWGVARTLLGLGDLARLTGAADVARRHYLEALGILRQVSARPEIARCLAGLGRIALDQGDLAQARQQFAESMVLSQSSGSRIGVIRGLDAFAALAARRGRPDRAVSLAAAAEALRAAAHLPPAPAARTRRILDSAAELGEAATGALWAAGSELTSADAVALALSAPPVPDPAAGHRGGSDDGGPGHGAPGGGGPENGSRRRSGEHGQQAAGLTAREREIAALIADGHRTRDIAARLFISPATVDRHAANIMSKLGFSSRAQIAAWQRRQVTPGRTAR
jgi:predicted ATPase/DNA-binding CsgD family transcriptional regulator